MEGKVENKKQQEYLETSFWNESDNGEDSDDEGIGSDESMDQNDQCSCINDNTNNDQNDEPKESKLSIKQTKDPLRVTKFLRVLKQSMVPNTSSSFSTSSRVFGVDLSSHLEIFNTDIPQVVEWCTRTIEETGKTDIKSLEGVYRLSGQVSHIKALKLSFDAGHSPTNHNTINIHSVGSLLKVNYVY